MRNLIYFISSIILFSCSSKSEEKVKNETGELTEQIEENETEEHNTLEKIDGFSSELHVGKTDWYMNEIYTDTLEFLEWNTDADYFFVLFRDNKGRKISIYTNEDMNGSYLNRKLEVKWKVGKYFEAGEEGAVYYKEQLVSINEPKFSDFLALFDQKNPLTNEITIPFDQSYYDNKEKLKVPDELMKFINFKHISFVEYNKGSNKFDEALKLELPFYASIKFKANNNITSVIIYYDIPAKIGVRPPSSHSFLLNYNNKDEMVSMLPVSFSYGNNYEWNTGYTHIYSPDSIKIVSNFEMMKETRGAESYSIYGITENGIINTVINERDQMIHLSRSWTFYNEDNGTKYISHKCKADPDHLQFEKDGVYYLTHTLGYQSKETYKYELLTIKTFKDNNEYHLTLKSKKNGNEINVIVVSTHPKFETAKWIGIAGFKDEQNYATDWFQEFGNIKIRRENCD